MELGAFSIDAQQHKSVHISVSSRARASKTNLGPELSTDMRPNERENHLMLLSLEHPPFLCESSLSVTGTGLPI